MESLIVVADMGSTGTNIGGCKGVGPIIFSSNDNDDSLSLDWKTS